MQNHNPETQIESKFLGPGDLFGIEFGQGIVFMEVLGVQRNKFKPFDNLPEVPAGGSIGFTTLDTDQGDDILYIDDPELKVIHAGIGTSPESIRRYTNYPSGGNRLRQHPDLPSPSATAGSDYGYVDGTDSPYDAPTDYEELVIPPLNHIEFSFFNPNQTKPVTPVLNITFTIYDIRILDPNLHRETIKRILQPGSPMPVYKAGSLDQQVSFNSTVGRGWNVNPISREEVAGR